MIRESGNLLKNDAYAASEKAGCAVSQPDPALCRKKGLIVRLLWIWQTFLFAGHSDSEQELE